MHKKFAAWGFLGVAVINAHADVADPAVLDARAVPFATERRPASAEECVVWRRELAFARSAEAQDKEAWASFLQPGAILNVGTAAALRGRAEAMKAWPTFAGLGSVVVRWRPGVVMIGGDPKLAVSLGPYVVQAHKDGVDHFEVGFYQTLWTRAEGDGMWRVMFDGEASTAVPVADRAAADTWVAAQAMSDCDRNP